MSAPVQYDYQRELPAARRRSSVQALMKDNDGFVAVVFQCEPGDASLPPPPADAGAAPPPTYTLMALPEDCTLEAAVLELKRVAGLQGRLVVPKVSGRPLRADNEMGELHRVYKNDEDGILYLHYSTLPAPAVSAGTLLALLAALAAAGGAYAVYRRQQQRN